MAAKIEQGQSQTGRLSRRTLLQTMAAGSLVLFGGAMASCAPSAAPSGTTEADADTGSAPVQEQVTVEFMNWGAVEGTPLQTAIDQYTEAKGTLVKVWPVPTRYEDKMRTLLAAGTTPDIMRVNDDYVRGYAAKNQLVNLQPYLEQYGYNPDDFYKFIYEFAEFDGGYWAWSLGNQPRLIFYNIDLFEEAGVPLPPSEWNPTEGWTWDDFLETAKALTKGEEQFGALIYHDTGYEQTWAMNNGGPGIYSEDGLKFTLADPEGIEAIQWAADLTCVHGVQPGQGLLNQLEGPQLFISGKLGMIFTGTTTSTAFRDEITDFNWDAAPVPMRVNRFTEGSLIVFCVPTAAPSPDAGWDLLDWMTTQEMGELFVQTRYFMPIRRSASETIEADEQPPQNVNLFVAGNEYHKSVNFAENTERARFIYRPQLDLVYSCTESAESVLTAIRPEVEAALEGRF